MGLDQYVYRVSKFDKKYDYLDKVITYEEYVHLQYDELVHIWNEDHIFLPKVKDFFKTVTFQSGFDVEKAFIEQIPNIEIKEDFSIVNETLKDKVYEVNVSNDNKTYTLVIDTSQTKYQVLSQCKCLYAEEVAYWGNKLFLSNWFYKNTHYKTMNIDDTNNMYYPLTKEQWLILVEDLKSLLYKQITKPFEDEYTINLEDISLDFIRDSFKELTNLINETDFDNQLLCYCASW